MRYNIRLYQPGVQHINPSHYTRNKKQALREARRIRNDFLAEKKPRFPGLFKQNDVDTLGKKLFFRVMQPGDSTPVFQVSIIPEEE